MATRTYIQNRRLGEEFWNKELEKYMGIQSGAIQPQQLPEFKSLYQNLMNMGNQQLQRLYQDAVARGIQGGALEQLMQQAQENINKGTLGWIQNMFQVANQRGGQAANTGMQWWMQRQHLLQQLANQRKSQHDIKQLAWANFGMNALKQAGTAAAGAMGAGMTGAEGAVPPGSTSSTGGAGSMTPYGARAGFDMPMQNYDWSSYNPQINWQNYWK